MPAVTVKLSLEEVDQAIRLYVGENTLPEASDESLAAAKITYAITTPKRGASQLTGASVEVKS